MKDSYEFKLSLPEGEIIPSNPATQAIVETAMQTLSDMMEYQELMLFYDSAIKIVQTKMDIINAAYQAKYQRNPIHNISSRRKKTISIVRKLYQKSMDITTRNIERELHDVAGIRVICPYLDDVYEVAQAITRQEDICLIQQKDYITNPKRNGYRSLHLIVSVPVSFAEQTKQVEVEIQIRTIAMDFWASLEHQLKYKNNLEEEAQIVERLRVCAETIAKTDVDMLAIRRDIDRGKEAESETEQMIQRLSKMEFRL